MEVKLLQSRKQSCPKVVTELGMVMEVKLLQPEKHLSPKLVTELGMVMAVKLLQFSYLLLVDYQYYTL